MDDEQKKEKKKFKRPLFHKIVNIFIGLVAGILFLIIIFFGFSQTKTFRNFLKDQITSTVSESINGTLEIEDLEGSVLSSLFLTNTILTTENDTIFKANNLVIKTSPIHLLLKRILIRDIILNNADFYLQEDQNGIWNLSKLSKTDSFDVTQTEVKDTTSSLFPFTIQVNNLAINNLNFIRQTYSNLNSVKDYKHLTTDDLRLSGIFLDAKLFANLSASTVRLFLKNFSVEPNFQSFNLRKLSGDFELTEDHALVNNLSFITDSSNIKLSAKIDELNLLGDVELRNFRDYPIAVGFEAYPLNFSDLYTFIDATDFLNGKADLNFKASGYFGDFNVKKLDLAFMNSFLSLNGKVQKLHTPENLFLDVNVTNSKIVESEAYLLVKGLDIPLFQDVVLENLNAKFKGEPTRFHSELSGDINNANVFIDLYMDLQTEQMEYDLEFNTKRLNIFPVTGLKSSLTSKGKIKGIGTDPSLMDASLIVTAFNSEIDSIRIDSVYFSGKIKSKLLDVKLSSIVNDAKTKVAGKLDLTDSGEPEYDLIGNINNLKLQEFTVDSRDSSNLNFNFTANGKNLTIDDMVGNYEITLEPSYLRELSLSETKLSLSLIKDNEDRNINLKSEFADVNIEGQFSLQKAIDILVYEGSTISQVISNKLDELNPIDDDTDSLSIKLSDEIIPQIVKEDLEFKYNFLFKDFELIAQFLKNDELDIVGSGEGSIKNDSLNFEISTDIKIENLLNKRENNIIYLSEVEANLNFSRDNREVSFNKMFGTVSFEGEKIYVGTEFNNIEADFIFNQSKLFFNTSLQIGDDLTTELEGIATTSGLNENIYFSNVALYYKNIPWVNYDTCTVLFNSDGVQLSNLILENGATVINLDGQINNDESHNFFVSVESMPAEVLSNYLFDDQSQPLGGNIYLNIVSTGELRNPRINGDLNINNISYNNVNFGSLTAVVNHQNYNSLFDIDFIDPEDISVLPLFAIDASLPFKINFLGNEKYLSDDSEIQISLRANDFNVNSLGNILPYVTNQSGKIKSTINISGTVNNLRSEGSFLLSDGRFTFRQNNLNYGLGIKAVFQDQIATVDSISLSNRGGSQYSGEITGEGIIELDKFPYSNFDFTFNGDLALLGQQSKTRNSAIYGDLFVKSDKNWKLTFIDDVYAFDGNILVERANLVYTSQANSNYGQNRSIIYRIIEDSSKMNLSNQKFVRILKEAEQNTIKLDNGEEAKFNLNTNIIINNIASFNFIIAPDLNQRLNVETTGKLEFKTVRNELKTQGALTLLSGSQLEFFKSFEADGSIRFENDITDPNFDIVATYRGEIENFANTGSTEEVAVKLKLNTAYSKIRENLSGNSQNLFVYVGASQIENDIPDLKYDQSNALTFIIFDQLNLDLNDEQKSTLGAMTENAAYSLLGSQLTSYLNSTLGGLISNIRLNKYSGRDSYKLLFSGKYNNIRYSFGGSFGQTDYLQLSKADIKVEYLFNPNFLIRLEQKSPIIETTTEERVQELALKYKFEF
jgi:hypothetical protein